MLAPMLASQTGAVTWTFEPPPALTTLVTVHSASAWTPLPDGRASVGGIRSVVSRLLNGTVRCTDIHSGRCRRMVWVS